MPNPLGAGFIRGDEDIAKVEAAVADPRGSGKIDRTGKLRQKWQRQIEGRRRVVPHRHVERFGGDIFLGAVGDRPFNTRGDRFDDRRVEEAGIGRARQLVSKRLRLLGGHIEPEHLDRDQTIARRFVGAKDGTERANTNLMQDPERSECRGWSERSRVVSGHSWGGTKKCSTDSFHARS